MPNIHISKSVDINASPEKIFTIIANFNNWTVWSPWLILEPEVQVTVSDDAKYYEWNGKRVGSGNMKIISEQKNQKVDYDLYFLTPWKSHAKVSFILKEKGDQTHVTWTMESSLPWFMFWMKSQMEGYVGMDYDRGLTMLKDYIETDEVPSKLEFNGVSDFKEITFVGVRNTCSMDKIEQSMKKEFEKLEEFTSKQGDICTEFFFAQYHKWDIIKMETTYTVGVGVKQLPDNLPNGFYNHTIPSTKVYTTRHIGPYKHLGNAWSAMMNLGQNKVFKQNKKIDPFEVYVSDPATTAEKELITDVCFPVR